LYLIEAGMHDSQSIISIEQLCDGIIEMTTEEDSGQVSHSLMVRRKHGSHPPEKAINFWVTEDGVQTL